MKKLVVLVLSIVLLPFLHAQQPQQQRERREDEQPPNPELQREEVTNLELETARAIQHNNGTFFRRVYSEDFAGTLSHGQPVDKTAFIRVVEDRSFQYEFFNASDIKVRLFQDVAVTTSLWTSKAIVKGQHVSMQMRTMHVYVSSPRGWKAIGGQITNLPPDTAHPL
ncbi:MAG TPA: nuclear transport factor 2 family protein [Candidatus Saccharimonadales bacterium]|nr:nuclear transport factor 2 family protein [Candidatus Saccharimonadales bacterium]